MNQHCCYHCLDDAIPERCPYWTPSPNDVDTRARTLPGTPEARERGRLLSLESFLAVQEGPICGI